MIDASVVTGTVAMPVLSVDMVQFLILTFAYTATSNYSSWESDALLFVS